MPYSKNSELPDSVKVLPSGAQTIWRKAFNAAEKEYDEEETAFKVAWSAVKKEYKKEGDKWVKEAKEQDLEEVYVGAAISFEQLETQEKADQRAFEIRSLTDAFKNMLDNIMWAEDIDKISEINRLTNEYTSRLGELIEAEQRQAIKDNEENIVEFAENEESPIEKLSESENGPLHALVRIIQPGWGNKKHNHYYPKDVLKRDAYRFVGAKMFETDHRPQEKSTRTWVSTIEDIAGFDEKGAPLAKVAVHDPGFAERLRNLDKLKALEKMECSIYANGTAKSGFKMGGREGKQVEAITNVSSVDWVTRAGAGGAAVSLVENDEELNMENEIKKEEEQEEIVQPAEEEKVEEVEIQESEDEQPLTVKEVKEILSETDLPKYAQTRLAYSGRFETKEEILEVAKAELEYIKTVTRSGKPYGLDKEDKKEPDKTNKFKEAGKAKDELIAEFMK